MKKYFLIIIAFTLFVFSCDLFRSGNYGTKMFWAQNLENDKFYQVRAELLISGEYCNVWAEIGSGVDEETAQKIADEYDINIHEKMMDVFGLEGTQFLHFGNLIADNTIKLADWFGDEDGKLCILLLDIKDDYKYKNDAYVAGYFWGGDLLYDSNHPIYKYSNKRDMIYIDTYPGLNNFDNLYRTLSHELQHLINISISLYYIFFDDTREGFTDLWIDEGLSSAAEYITYGHSRGRISYYNMNETGLIEKGNNFFVWNNRYNKTQNENEHPNAVLDDYATVYLFFQWLRIQNKSMNIYGGIISSEYFNYKAVTEAAKAIKPEYSEWGNLLGAWLAANHDYTGEDGYKSDFGESEEFAVVKHYAPKGIHSLDLYPGEGVYSYSANKPDYENNENIVYLYLDKNRTLITYNKNSDILGNKTKGSVTGLHPPAANLAGQNIRSALSFNVPAGPYPISAGDMRRRRGFAEFPFLIDDLGRVYDLIKQRGNN